MFVQTVGIMKINTHNKITMKRTISINYTFDCSDIPDDEWIKISKLLQKGVFENEPLSLDKLKENIPILTQEVYVSNLNIKNGFSFDTC